MGLVWLLTNTRTVEGVREVARRGGFDRIHDVAGDAFDAARSTIRSGAQIRWAVAPQQPGMRCEKVPAMFSITQLASVVSTQKQRRTTSVPCPPRLANQSSNAKLAFKNQRQ
jgi:hypothetical protein